MKTILVGSSYFFKSFEGFKSKDTDRVVLIEHPVGFKNVRQTSGSGSCLFEWRKMTADEFVEYALTKGPAMQIGKFLVPEFCEEIGFTIEHLKKLEPLVEKLDVKHGYEKIIYNSYIKNGVITAMETKNGEWIMYGVKEDDPYCLHTVEELEDYINEIGEELENKYPSVKYLYADFKKGDGITLNDSMNKKLNLYHQNYCGCIYSIR